MEENIDDEIIALKAIYEEDLKITDVENGKEIRITITPATADDEASKYVCLDICIKIPKSYPSSSPQFIITRSRGLSDEYLKELTDALQSLVKENVGNCVLFDLLDSVREHLTDNNIPSDICSICLCGFRQSSSFLKTNCFHYFHQYCLKHYKEHVFKDSVDGILSLIEDTNNLSIQKSIVTVPCPVCKTPCDINVESINEALAPEDEEIDIDFDSLRKQRREFENMYRLQLEKGGVIDLEKEKNKFLISNLQQDYDAYMASARVENPNDNDTLSMGSVPNGADTKSTRESEVHGSRRGRRMRRRNFHRGHSQNLNHHQPYRPSPQQQQQHLVEQQFEAPCSSLESQKIVHHHDEKASAFSTKMLAQKGGGYSQTNEYGTDTKTFNPPTRYPLRNRGGRHSQNSRRPYRGFRGNSKRKDLSRNQKFSEKSEL